MLNEIMTMVTLMLTFGSRSADLWRAVDDRDAKLGKPAALRGKDPRAGARLGNRGG